MNGSDTGQAGEEFPQPTWRPPGEVTCYPSPGKRKALKVCRAFAEGCGGRLAAVGEAQLSEGIAFFYGWTQHTARLIARCKAEGRRWYYADNAYYFGRGVYYRVTRGALMHDGAGHAPWDRAERLGIDPKPWRYDGEHIVLATQSELFYRLHLSTSRDAWTERILGDLKARTGRPIVVCHKPPVPWPDQWPHANFEQALEGAWAVASHSSSVMVKAIVEGVPVVSLGPSMASRMATGVRDLETPYRPSDGVRRQWLADLAANQWTRDEMRDGVCWRAIR
jgi:hypothetical protein